MDEQRKAPQQEEGFREALKDVVAVVEKLAPYCQSFDDLVSMVKLAVENDGQLRLLMKTLHPNQQPKR